MDEWVCHSIRAHHPLALAPVTVDDPFRILFSQWRNSFEQLYTPFRFKKIPENSFRLFRTPLVQNTPSLYHERSLSSLRKLLPIRSEILLSVAEKKKILFIHLGAAGALSERAGVTTHRTARWNRTSDSGPEGSDFPCN